MKLIFSTVLLIFILKLEVIHCCSGGKSDETTTKAPDAGKQTTKAPDAGMQ